MFHQLFGLITSFASKTPIVDGPCSFFDFFCSMACLLYITRLLISSPLFHIITSTFLFRLSFSQLYFARSISCLSSQFLVKYFLSWYSFSLFLYPSDVRFKLAALSLFFLFSLSRSILLLRQQSHCFILNKTYCSFWLARALCFSPSMTCSFRDCFLCHLTTASEIYYFSIIFNLTLISAILWAFLLSFRSVYFLINSSVHYLVNFCSIISDDLRLPSSASAAWFLHLLLCIFCPKYNF